jgi:SAM-dependent methyltransferase
MPSPNAETLEAWNTAMFEKWVRYRDVVAKGIAVHSDAALIAVPPPRGARVVDIGCGMGDLTRDLAELVGAEGSATGIDGAARFVEYAAQSSAEAKIANVRFFRADVESEPLEGPYDVAYSRFGTMFFANPLAAFQNIRSALATSAKLCMVVWRKREDNAFFIDAQRAIDPILPPTTPPPAAGPFSMVDADVVSDLLVRAGFARVALERHDAPYVIGRDLDQAVEIGMNFGPVGERLRSYGADVAEAKKSEVAAALRKAFAPYVTERGVPTPSSTWIVTAVA